MLKKLTTLTLLILFSLYTTVFSFNFPEPDWGKLYNEKMNMVKETDFELYAEASVKSTPYYGAKLEPRDGIYIGSVAENAEKLLPLGSYLTNVDGMNQSDLYYPTNTMVKRDNVVTMVGWTIYNMSTVDYGQVRRTLDTLNSYNKPMFIRFANEMNCSELGDNPEQYIEVFRTIADMIHQYPNFAVVWSPNDLGALDRPFDYFYPGDEYVDWIGISNYMVKYFRGNRNTTYKESVYFMTGDYSWSTNKIKPIMDWVKKNNITKPIMISEGGVATSNSFGEECQSWAIPRLRNMLWYPIMKYPQIKMINYFDVHRNSEVEKFDISNYPYAVNIFNEAKNSGAYITKYGNPASFAFQPANDAGTLTSKNGTVNLYTLAYFPQNSDVTVTYNIDGAWYHSSNQIPYICRMNISDITDGQHTMTIRSNGTEKNFVFYKRGQCIRFGAEPDSADTSISDNTHENPNIDASYDTNIKVMLNGREIETDQPPVLINDRTLVPMRAIFNALGAEVEWNDETQTASGTKNGKTVNITINEKLFLLEEKQRHLMCPLN